MSQQSLKDKTIKGTMWSAIDNVAQFGVQFIVSIVLARLLSPDDYGLIGIIFIFTAICDAIIGGGFGLALIRKKDATEDDFNTAFITNVGFSFVFYIIMFFGAPLIAHFFNRYELVALIRVSSLSMIIGAFAMVQQTRLTKQIDFKSQTKITFIASVISGIVGIIMALLGFGVWALVAQGIVSNLIKTILLWVHNRWIPDLSFSKSSFKELFGFGWKMTLSQVLNNIYNQLYQVVVGKFYSPATLGQYTRAKNFSQLFAYNLTNVIQRVTYPMLSTIQDDKTRMIDVYRRTIKVVMFVSFACSFGLAAIAEPLIYCLIGPKWNEAALYLPFIAVMGSLYPLHSLNLNMLQVQGRSDLFLGLEIIKKILGVVPLLIGAFVGILPMLYVSIINSVISYFLNSYFPGKLLGYKSWMQIKDIAHSFFMAGVMAVCVYFLKYIPISYWIVLPLQVLFGVGLYIILSKVTKSSEYTEVIAILQSIFNKFKKN